MEDLDGGLLKALMSDSDGEDCQDWGDTDWAQPQHKHQDSTLAALHDMPKTSAGVEHDPVSSIQKLRAAPQSEGSCGIVKRMQLNDNKAGMEGLDKVRINEIIFQASKGSKFYENERKKEEHMKIRIEEQKKKMRNISEPQLQQGLIEANRLLSELEESRDLSRTIVHVDMDAFYAAVEMRDTPALKDKPMAVGGTAMLSTSNYHARKFGVRAAMPGFIAKKLCPELIIVPSSSEKYTAVSKQVKRIMAEYDPGFCPMSLDEAYLDLTNHLEFRQSSLPEDRTFICKDRAYTDSPHHCLCDLNDVMKDRVLHTCTEGIHDDTEIRNDSFVTENQCSPKCETGNIPGGYTNELDNCNKKEVKDEEIEGKNCDTGDSETTLANVCPVCSKEFPPFTTVEFGMSVEEAVRELRTRIEQRTRLTASAGIAPNMMLAKVCSDKNKPDGQYRIQPTRDDVLTFIRDLPTRKISGIGKVGETMLNAVGVYTCTDLRERRALLYHLYSQISFHYFMRICLGIGATTVECDSERKSISTERTFQEVNRPEDLYAKCAELCDSLAQDIKEQQLMGKTVTLKIKTVKFQVTTRAQSLPSHTCDRDTIHRAAMELLKTEILACAPQPLRLRLMGVRLSNLVQESQADGKKSRQNTITGAFQKMLKTRDHGHHHVPTSGSDSIPNISATQNTCSPSTSSIEKQSNQSSDEVKSDDILGFNLNDKSGDEDIVVCLDDDDNVGIAASGIHTRLQQPEPTSDDHENDNIEGPSKSDEHEDDVVNSEASDVVTLDNSVTHSCESAKQFQSDGGESTQQFLNSPSQIVVDNNKMETIELLAHGDTDKALTVDIIVSDDTTSPGKHSNQICTDTESPIECELAVAEKYCEHDNSKVTMEPQERKITQTESGDNSQSYSRMRSGRVRTPEVPNAKRRRNSSAQRHSKLETYVCPVCCQQLVCRGLKEFNEHIDGCLSGKTEISDDVQPYSKTKASENVACENGTSVMESSGDKYSDSGASNACINVDKKQTDHFSKDTFVDLETAASNSVNDEIGVLLVSDKESVSFNELPDGFTMKCDHKPQTTEIPVSETDTTHEINNNACVKSKSENVLNVKTSSDFETNIGSELDIKSDAGNDEEVSLKVGATLIDDDSANSTKHNSILNELATTDRDMCNDINTDLVLEECITDTPPLPELPDNCCYVQKVQPAESETICGTDDPEFPSFDNVEYVATDVPIKSQDSCFNKFVDENSNNRYSVDSPAMKLQLGCTDYTDKDCDIICSSKQLENNSVMKPKPKCTDYNGKDCDIPSTQLERNSAVEPIPSCTDYNTQDCDIPCTSNQDENAIFIDDSDEDNTGNSPSFPVNSDQPETPGDGSLLVCPICNIEQRVVSLSAFNDHVDACLSRGAITEILREQRRSERGNGKRLLSTSKSTSQPPTKRKKTSMPPIKVSSCRSIASFFKDK